MGARFGQEKLQFSGQPVILGVTYDLEGLILKIKQDRKDELLDEINAILSSQVLAPGHAGKLRGKLMFGASQLWVRALAERQYSSRKDPAGLSKALIFASHGQ